MIVGIDPGKTGAIAALTGAGSIFFARYMPMVGDELDAHTVREWIEAAEPVDNGRLLVMIERVSAMPGGGERKMGATSAFTFGANYGALVAIMRACRFPFDRVRPQDWKRTFTLNGKDKDEARLLAQDLWPGARDVFKLKKAQALADAVLIAEHARRTTL